MAPLPVEAGVGRVVKTSGDGHVPRAKGKGFGAVQFYSHWEDCVVGRFLGRVGKIVLKHYYDHETLLRMSTNIFGILFFADAGREAGFIAPVHAVGMHDELHRFTGFHVGEFV